ncbi:MAG: hypothetical protein LUQ25_02710, partial [Methanoregulaceae archaeon]|nr:hypothetical protein [Methanoregulaceae archaeon]
MTKEVWIVKRNSLARLLFLAIAIACLTYAVCADADNVSPLGESAHNAVVNISPPEVSAQASQTMLQRSNIARPTIDVTGTTTPSAADAAELIARSTNAANPAFTLKGKRVTQAEREAAADRFRAMYEKAVSPGSSTDAVPVMDPGGVPHYFGPYPNYANSPMPRGRVGNITVLSRGSGYTAPVVRITDVYYTGTGATATATVTGGRITSIRVTNRGTNYTAPRITITDPTGTGASAEAGITGPFNGGIRKFINGLPGLTAASKNNIGQYLPVAIPDTTSYPAGGTGYASAPTVTISDATGTGASASAGISGGSVATVFVTNGGSGYTENPVVSFSGGGATTQA